MKKCLAFIYYKCVQSLQFRTEILVWILLDFAPFLGLFLILDSMYNSQEFIKGLTLSQTVSYFFFAALIQGLTSTHFEALRIEEIRTGKLDFFFVRPFSYLLEVILSDLAGKLFYLTLFLPLYAFFFFYVRSSLEIVFPTPSVTQLTMFTLLLFFAYAFELSIALQIVLLGFWFEGSQGLEHFKWLTLALLSGSFVPKEFMPDWLRFLTQMLPFQYMYLVPIEIIQTRRVLQLGEVIHLVVYSLLFILLPLLIWKFARREYTSAGG